LGFVISPCISDADVDQILQLLEGYTSAWLLTSVLMQPVIASLSKGKLSAVASKLKPLTVQNSHLGGNIMVLDMATVDDISRTISENLRDSPPPDLILLPSSGFNSFGTEIEDRFSIRLSLLYNTTRYTF
jgi:hypothetical protein